jgi:TamB, inner membrane protein subunit of TAM complex
MRKARRWILRIVIGLLATVFAVIATALIVLHTDWGREQVREQVEARLNDMFVGGAKVGRLEGSPFGELVVRDLVINDPRGEPAISAGTVRLRIALAPLISKEAHLSKLVIEDADVLLERDERGQLRIANLMKPGPKSGWSVDLPDVRIHRAHIAYDTGKDGERMNLDGVELRADAHLPADQPITAAVDLSAHWRERGVPLALDATVRSGDEGVAIGRAFVRGGDVVVTAEDVRIGKTAAGGMDLAGTISVEATRDAVARLGIGVELPADISVRVQATRTAGTPWTRVALTGRIDGQPLTGTVQADLEGKRFVGFVSTGLLDVTRLSGGGITGSAAAFVTFDAALQEGRELPVGTAMVHSRGTLEGLPETEARIALSSTGQRATALVDVDGPDLRANIVAEVEKRGQVITLHRGTLVAATTDPKAASGGKAPLRGAFHANLTASGALAPEPNLAVAGKIDGKRLRVRDLSIDSMKLAIDARQLPARPLGRAELDARGVQRDTVYLAELAVKAANRQDGRIAVSVRTRPKQAPWLVETDALVTLGETVTIDLQRHHVRAGNGTDWRGTSGRIAIAPERIEIRDFATKSQRGELAVASAIVHRGRRAGDIEAHAEAKSIGLESFNVRYRGDASAKVDVVRRGGRLDAHVELTGRRLVFVPRDPKAAPVDADAKIDVREGRLAVDLSASSPRVGKVSVAADIAAPRDAANARAWQALGKDAIRESRITLERLDVGRLAALANRPGEHRGIINGELRLSGAETGGAITVRGLVTPQTSGLGKIDADLQLSQTPRGELVPALAARVGGLGTVDARAAIVTPARPFDPLAWRRLGKGAIASASVRTSELAFDPGTLDRFGVATNLRGRASLAIDVEAGLRAARVTGRIRDLRGRPIAQPVNIELTAEAGAQATTLRLVAGTTAARFIEVDGRIPRSLAQLQAGGPAVKRAPLAVTVKLPDVRARQLLATFGRTDVVDGTIAGTIDVAGTVSAPTARAKITATNIALPSTRTRPTKRLDRLTVDAIWDGQIGTLLVSGSQPENGELRVLAKGSPAALERATVSLRATKFDLRPVLVLVPGAVGAMAGVLDANVAVTSLDPRTMRAAGELHLTRARIPIAPTVGTLRGAKIDIVAGQRDLRLALDGKLGDGTVKASGTIALVGAAPTGGDLKVTLRNVSPIGAVEPRITADVTAKLSKGRDRWIADVVVDNGSIVVPAGRGEELKPVGPPPDMVFLSGKNTLSAGTRQRADEPPEQPVIEARIKLNPTYIKSEELRGIIKGQLTLTADAGAVGIVGRIEADRGDLDLFGRRYLVERALARFDGSTDPLLDVVITHDFPEVTTVTSVRGRVSKPELIMSSEPGIYTQGQLLGFLLGGEPNGEPAQGNPRDRVTAAGTSFVANRIGGYFKKALPFDVDVLKYEAATASSSAAFTIGTWLTRSLFVAYRHRIDARADENTGEAEAEYWVTRRVMVEGTLGDRGYSGLDLLWRKRY